VIASFLIVLILLFADLLFNTSLLIILATIVLLIIFYEFFTVRVLINRRIGLRFILYPKDSVQSLLAEIADATPCASATARGNKIKIVMHCKEPKAELLKLWNTGKVNRII